MKLLKGILPLLMFLNIAFCATVAHAQTAVDTPGVEQQFQQQEEDELEPPRTIRQDTEDHEVEAHGHPPAVWSITPFVLILLLIATGPLFFPHVWHRFYPLISVFLGVIVILYYLFSLQNYHQPLHSLAEYISFIALLSSLFIASGGILIKIDKEGTPLMNTGLLIFGAFISNFIGTTGASMLLIRPFMRLNQHRLKPFHVVFFIFMVSNVGGSLTPIGDPPLFLGFLKGVPFFWTLEHIWPKWLFGIALLAIIYYLLDSRFFNAAPKPIRTKSYTGMVRLKGTKNFVWLAIIIAAVFIDPSVFPEYVPALVIGDIHFSYIREIIMFTVGILAFKFADKRSLKGNEFDFEPIKEVAFLFIGIFATMMPALELIGNFAQSPEGSELINTDSLFWLTGFLSSMLDNAPTYLNFLAAGMAKVGLNINDVNQVIEYANLHVDELLAISVSAVFFGAMTYIGNGPNFMVKAIAEQSGLQMPSFMGYIIRFSIPFLLPVLVLTYIVFFYFM